ncbi:DUF3958 family protein [Bacillus cereus]|uniref:DUF3958 family protein n=1 Tax=Bacillus cereus TaxID=1396 RepID=UPI000C28D866|nr:DUF3958 family protein [Bacillus cereus]
MSQDIEKQMYQLNQNLRIVFEKQNQNQSAIQTQEQVEESFHVWKNQNKRLFDRILETWHRDRDMSLFFMGIRQGVQNIERKFIFELKNQKETLLKEKRSLSNLENDLPYEQQQLIREGNA